MKKENWLGFVPTQAQQTNLVKVSKLWILPTLYVFGCRPLAEYLVYVQKNTHETDIHFTQINKLKILVLLSSL